MKNRHHVALWTVLLALTLILACGDPEEKKMKFFDKGKALYEQGEYVKARLELKNAVQIDPKFARGYYYLGLTAQQQRDFRQAFGNFSKAAELDPNLLDAQLELGKLYLGGRAPDKALERADLVLAAEPDNIPAAVLKASVLLQQKNVAEARKLLQELLAKGATDPDIFLLLALAALQENDPTGALDILQKGVAANPDSARLYTLMARAYAGSKKTDQAVAALEKVMAIEPDNLNHRFTMAALLWETQQRSQADRTLSEIIGKDPQNEENRIQVARFYLTQKQVEDAEKVLREGIEEVPDGFKLRFALSEIYLQQNRPDDAEKTLKECLELVKDPADVNILQTKTLLARALLAKGEVAEAEALVDEVIQGNPKNADAHFIKGRLHLLRKEGDAAVSEFRTVVTEKPELEAGYLNLAEAHLIDKQTALAVDTLKSAVNAMPGSKNLHRALAKVYASQKDFAAAEAQLEKILEIDPQDVGIYANLGDLLTAAGQTARAEEAYRKIYEQAPQSPLGPILLSRLYQREKKPDEAVAVLAGAYRDNPQSTRLFASLVQAHMANGQVALAVDLCRQRLAQSPEDVFALNLLGAVYSAQKEYAEAEKALNRAIELQPLWPVPYTNLARLYLVQGKTDEAIGRFEAALAANPQNSAAYMTLGTLYEKKKEVKKAIGIYEQALELHPNMWAAANNLAFLLSEASDDPQNLARALSLARKADDMRPGEPVVKDTMAWIYFKQGDLTQARQILSQLLTDAPENPVFNYHMGAVLAESGSSLEARQKLEAALAGGQEFMGREEAEALLAKLK